MGNPSRATVMSATRSPSELPTAKIVNPRMASDMLRITPKVRRTPTTSLAIVLIQAMATANPTKQSAERQFGGRFGVVVKRMNARTLREPTKP